MEMESRLYAATVVPNLRVHLLSTLAGSVPLEILNFLLRKYFTNFERGQRRGIVQSHEHLASY